MSAGSSWMEAALWGQEGRERERLELKAERMLASPFALYRASARLHYAGIHELRIDPLAPRAWASGDAHLENIGAYESWAGHSALDITDFDEAHLGWAWTDILRLLASLDLALAARGMEAAGREMARRALGAFLSELSEGKARWLDERSAGGLCSRLIEESRGADAKRRMRKIAALGKRGWEIRAKEGSKTLPASREDKERAREAFAALGYGKELAFEDAARRASGLGSLGLERWLVLARGEAGLSALDIKECDAGSFGADRQEREAFPHQAERVWWAQRALQALEPRGLSRGEALGKSFVGKELLPSAMRLDLGREGVAEDLAGLGRTGEDWGRLLAWGHLRASGRKGAASAEEMGEWARAQDPAEWLGRAEALASRARKAWSEAREEAEAFGGARDWLEAWLSAPR